MLRVSLLSSLPGPFIVCDLRDDGRMSRLAVSVFLQPNCEPLLATVQYPKLNCHLLGFYRLVLFDFGICE